MTAPTIKCVIWDLDETLWRGTLAESDRVELSDEVRAVVAGLDERGILQSVCSRNDHDQAWRRLEELGVADYFVLPRIGWGPKSAAVSEIVERLGFAHSAVAFVDDQPVERAEVAYRLPGIRCYPADQASLLLGLPEFDPPRTATSARRRQLYQTEERRNAARTASTGTDADFLRSLRAELTIEQAGARDLDRLAELTLRTTQLNTTGVPYSPTALAALRDRPDHDVLVVRLTDRFGDYGEVGVVLLARLPGVWRIRLLATSCRVLAHGVGTVVLRWLVDQAHRAGVHLAADFRRTDRNRQMAVAYRFAGFDDAPCACRTAVAAGQDVQVLHLLPSPQPPEDTLRLRAHPLTPVTEQDAPMPQPRSTDVATAVRDAWERCLDHQDVPDDQNFFQAGGNSLEGAELMAALSRRFGRRLRLALLIRNPTLRGLTDQVEHVLRNDLAPAVRGRTADTGTEGGA